MKKRTNEQTCPSVLSNQCVVWQSGDIPALDICNGDQLSEAEKIIADKIVKLMDDTDMSKITLSCILDKCKQKNEDRSLKSLIQLLFDNQCCLRDLLNSTKDEKSSFVVNMKCLKKFDDFGNEIIQDQNQAIQTLVNEVCTHQIKIANLESRVNLIETTPISTTPPYIEPRISTCLTPGSLTAIQILPIVAKNHCDLRISLGSDEEISQAMSQQCPNLNTTYGSTVGWNNTVANMAQTINNQWIVICDLASRLKLIETNCCKVSCDSIIVDYNISYEEGNLVLDFTTALGTKIPAGFVDCGSQLVISNSANQSVAVYVPIAENYKTLPIDVSIFSTGEIVTLKLNLKMCSGTTTCQKCLSKTIKLNHGCCSITNTGSTPVDIVYKTVL